MNMKSKLTILISFLLMSFQVFSQKDISDSVVVIPKSTVVKIVKDLERYDLCKKESLIKDSVILDYKHVVLLKDSTITKYQEKENSYNKEISLLNQVDSVRIIQINNLNTEVKRYKKQRTGVIGVSIIVLTLFFII